MANVKLYKKKITLNSLFEALERKKVDAKVVGGYNKRSFFKKCSINQNLQKHPNTKTCINVKSRKNALIIEVSLLMILQQLI